MTGGEAPQVGPWWIVGAGGIGSTLAGRVPTDVDLLIVDTWPAHVQAMTQGGLHVDYPAGSVHRHVEATELDEVVGSGRPAPACILLCVKSFQTADVLDRLDAVLADTTLVVSLQNGLNEYVIRDHVGESRTVGAVVRYDGALRRPGRAVQHKRDGDLLIGALDGSRPPRLQSLATSLSRAVPTTVVTDVWDRLWSKLLRNCMVNPTSAVSGLTLGELARTDHGVEVCRLVAAEVVAVATALGVHIDPPTVYGADPRGLAEGRRDAADAFRDGFRSTYAGLSELRPSMQQDLDKGRPTEIDHLNGVVTTRGREAGVPTPVNDALVELVHAIAAGSRRRGPHHLEELT